MTDSTILLISVGITLLFAGLFYFFFKMPDSQNYYIPVSSDLDPNLQKLLKVFGPEILGLAPDGMKKKLTRNEELDLLIKKSGNPWNVTVEELKQLANEIFTPENMSISVGYDSWYTKKSTLEKKCRKMRKILGGQYL